MLVAVGIREEAVGIDDALVDDDFVLVGFFNSGECFGVGVSSDLVRNVQVDLTGVFFGLGDFVDEVGFEEIKVQLRLPTRVEGETADLAFNFPVLGSVPIILGASGSKFDDVIPGFEFISEFAKMISKQGTGFAGFAGEDDGIRVEVEDLLGIEFAESVPVQFESSPTGGETGDEDVDVDLHGFFVSDFFVDDFDHFVGHDAQGLEFSGVVVEEFVQSVGFGDGFDLTLVALLAVLAPETVQHHLGQGASSGIFLDLVGLEGDAFFVSVVVEVLSTFILVVADPVGPPAGFLLDLEKGVDVGGEQSLGPAREMPDLVHVLDDVASIEGFL